MGEPINEKLNSLLKEGKVPTKNFAKGTEFKRWQSQPQESGVYYGKPEGDAMGRFNDPTGNTGVCYIAETATTAIAESYGRNKKKNDGSDIPYRVSKESLEKAHICTLKTKTPITTVDLGKLLPKLDITLDQITSDDYHLTQQIVSVAANDSDFDGISYSSRHIQDGCCIALFDRKKEQLETIEMTSMSQYSETGNNNLPNDWESEDIDAEEILTEILNIPVF